MKTRKQELLYFVAIFATLLICVGAYQAGSDLVMNGALSSVDNQVVRFNGATGKSAQASYVYIDDTGNITAPASALATIGAIKIATISYDTSEGISEALLDIAIGASASSKGAGYHTIISSSIGDALYCIDSNGTNWYFSEKTKAP